MFKGLFDSNERQLSKLRLVVEQINSFEGETEKMSPEEIKNKTNKCKEELRNLPEDEQTAYINKILPEAFAVVREASKRTLNKRHFDVQMMAGIVLHEGKISEQKTGEGKTLTATLPLYLNSLSGKGVHLVTPNDYLSRHGLGWMGPIYNMLGVSASVIMDRRAFVYDPAFNGTEFEDEYTIHLKECSKRDAYSCDIVYGTNHEFGFDYLRDNMAYRLSDIVQTNPLGHFGVHNYAIVDEVDSILIDVARTPLIISASAYQATERYHQSSSIVKTLLNKTDYEVLTLYTCSGFADSLRFIVKAYPLKEV